MKKHVSGLETGDILKENVMGLTALPIIQKGTALTSEHLMVLKEFGITEVDIKENSLNTQTPNKEEQISEVKSKQFTTDLEFTELYKHAVKKYKNDFIQWQSGSPIKVEGIREYLYPLIEYLETDDSFLLSLHTLSNKQEYIYHHAIAVGVLSGMVAKKLGYAKGQYLQAGLAGCLANAGMARVSPSVINKAAALTEAELKEIKNHPISSLNMVKNSPLLKSEGKLGILQHHERLDGSGYPLGEKGRRIHKNAMIIAIADVFHALTAERTYQKKISPFQALEMIKIDNFGQFDIAVIDALFSLIADLSIGTKIKLSNGITGEVLFVKSSSLTRPLVKLVDLDEIIDLEQERNLYISEII